MVSSWQTRWTHLSLDHRLLLRHRWASHSRERGSDVAPFGVGNPAFYDADAPVRNPVIPGVRDGGAGVRNKTHAITVDDDESVPRRAMPPSDQPRIDALVAEAVADGDDRIGGPQ